jgi:hypothetical protein
VIRRVRLPGRDRPRRAATIKQRHRLADLAKQAGVEAPAVVWYEDAADAIERLEAYLQPQLDGMDRLP